MKKTSLRRIKRRGKAAFKDQLSDLMLVQLIYAVGLNVVTIISLTLGSYIVYGPLEYGLYETNFRASQGEDVTPEIMLHPFKEHFGDSFLAGLIQLIVKMVPKTLITAHILVVLCTFTSLFTKLEIFDFGASSRTIKFAIITGTILVIADIVSIIMRFALAMTQYILVRNPGMDPIDALKASGRLMKGYKFRLFMLKVSFIGWAILSAFTATISNIYSAPYYYASVTAFFNDIYEKKVLADEQV